MPYSRPMGGDNPSLFVFVLDQSRSMGDPWPQQQQLKKADALADVLNNTLSEISARCVKDEGKVSNRCHIAILGYEGRNVRSVWSGTLAGKDVVPIAEVSENPAEMKKTTVRVLDGRGGLVEQEQDVPVWVVPTTGGGTPMKKALAKAHELVQQWLPGHPNAFPPIVIHVTDGESTDGDPSAEAQAIRNLSTSDGNVVLVNIHIPSKAPIQVTFPSDEGELPSGDPAARLLYSMSSVIPAELLAIAQKEGLNAKANSRMMALNADAISVIKLIQFATVGTLDG